MTSLWYKTNPTNKNTSQKARRTTAGHAGPLFPAMINEHTHPLTQSCRGGMCRIINP